MYIKMNIHITRRFAHSHLLLMVDNTFLTVEQVLSDISEFSVRAEIVPTSLEETPFTWIDTVKVVADNIFL